VVLQHHLGHRPGEVDAADDVEAAAGVALHELHLGHRQLDRSAEDLARYGDLADVVQFSGDPDPADHVVRQPEVDGDSGGQGADPALVPGGVGVSYLAHGGQRTDGGLQAAAQPRGVPQAGDAVGQVVGELL